MKIKEEFNIQIGSHAIPVSSEIKIKFYSITVPDQIEIEERRTFGEDTAHRTNSSEAIWCMIDVIGDPK